MLAGARLGRKAVHPRLDVRETAPRLLRSMLARVDNACVALPLLVVVSGPPGSGKSTWIHIVRCHVDPAVAWERINRRSDELPARRLVHGDPSPDEPFESFVAKLARFDPVVLPVPTMESTRAPASNPSSRRSSARWEPGTRRADGDPTLGPGLRRAWFSDRSSRA